MLAPHESEAILEKVKEVLEHGYGKVEVVVQENKISMLKVEILFSRTTTRPDAPCPGP